MGHESSCMVQVPWLVGCGLSGDRWSKKKLHRFAIVSHIAALCPMLQDGYGNMVGQGFARNRSDCGNGKFLSLRRLNLVGHLLCSGVIHGDYQAQAMARLSGQFRPPLADEEERRQVADNQVAHYFVS